MYKLLEALPESFFYETPLSVLVINCMYLESFRARFH